MVMQKVNFGPSKNGSNTSGLQYQVINIIYMYICECITHLRAYYATQATEKNTCSDSTLCSK